MSIPMVRKYNCPKYSCKDGTFPLGANPFDAVINCSNMDYQGDPVAICYANEDDLPTCPYYREVPQYQCKPKCLYYEQRYTADPDEEPYSVCSIEDLIRTEGEFYDNDHDGTLPLCPYFNDSGVHDRQKIIAHLRNLEQFADLPTDHRINLRVACELLKTDDSIIQGLQFEVDLLEREKQYDQGIQE